MLFDTDVLIWFLRGSEKAAETIAASDDRSISIINYMELLRGSRDKNETKTIKEFLADFSFRLLPLTENIGHRASIYVEEYGLKSKMGVADALVAATAVENRQTLLTGNQKHYQLIRDLETKVFRPR
jgi:predicted nucleic acid-binding protein